jgi:hypothetical protein
MWMNNYNEVSDLGLAASLAASGFVVDRVDKSNPRRVIFIFEASDALKDCVDLFWAGKLLLSATTLLEQIRLLKARIYG